VNNFAQTTNAFRVNYNQALFDLPGNAVEALTPNNYVFAGTNMTFLPIYGTVTQVNETGTLAWSKRYSDASIGFQLWDIKKDASLNEYYVCGGSESNAAVFMRLDASGNLVVSKKFQISQASSAFFNRVVKTSDGGYVAVGYVTGYDPDGTGPEIQYSPITYTDTDGNSQTDYISSPLIVKMDANGNHLWHKVFRYYTNATKDPATQRIYNDAAFNDVVETVDGYVAVGQYDVNQHRSATNSDGDDATPTDALILKTDFLGTIVYHKQYDGVSSSTTQSSKTLSAINKTSGGIPIAAGIEGSKEWIIKFAGSGAWSPAFSRVFTFPGFGAVGEPSQIYEANGGTDIITMGTYINPFAFTFANYLHRSNSVANANVWTRSYTFSLLAILPRGSQTSDNGNLLLSLTLGGTNYDYHLIKTDPDGNTPLTGCAATNLTPTAGPGPTTTADPFYNFWSGTVGPQAITVVASNISPTSNIQCSFVACTPPASPTAAIAAQPNCSTTTGSITLTGLPTSGTWTVNGTPSGTATGNTSSTAISSLAPGNYTFTVTLAGCTSASSNSVTINAAPVVPTAPAIGTITQPTCSVGTGSIALSGLPSSGTWTVTGTPSGSATGAGTTTTISGLAPGSYTFTVSNGTCTSVSSTSDVINAQPTVPTAPIVGSITQPTCSVTTGSVALSGLPSSGTWTVTASPGGTTTTGTGTTTAFTGLTGGSSYTFTVSNGTCTSTASTSAAINTAPTVPTAPIIGTITQTNCTTSTGSIALNGLPSSGTWAVTGTPSGSATGTGTSTTITGLTAGSYTFTVSNGTCTSTASTAGVINAQPTTPSAPIVGTITQPSCSTPAGSVNLTGLPSSGTWTVTASPGGITSTGTGSSGSITGLAANTTYTFTVNNGFCSSTASNSAALNAAPVVPTAPVVGTITQPTCTAPTGTVALSGLPSSGSWTVTASPGGTTITGTGTTANFTGLNPGNSYTFTVTNSATCTSAASTSAAINTVPGAPSTPVIGTFTQANCAVSTGSIELTGLPSSGTWTVTTAPGGTITNGSGTSTTLTGLTAGTTYTFTVTNDLGCTSASSTNAILNAAPATPSAPLIGTITNPTCSVSTGSVVLNGLPSTGLWTLTVTPGGSTTTGTGTTGTFSGLTANATYIFTVTNADGCISTSSLNAAISAQPITPTTPITGTVTQPVCTSPTGTVNLSGLPSGSWTITATPGGSTITGTGSTIDFTGLAPGNNFTFTVTNAAGCTSIASTSITINSVPGAPSNPTAGTVTQPTCAVPSGSIEVSSPLGAQYTYSIDGTNFIAGTTFSNLIPGTYTITVLDNGTGCSSVSVSTITIDPVSGAPVVTLFSSTDVTCSGDADGEISVSVAGGQAPYTYSWNPNVGSGSTISNISGGSYEVTVTDDLGCSSSATFSINEPASLDINGISSNVICGTSDGSISTSVSGGTAPYTYDWSPNGEITASLSGLSAGNYAVQVTDDNGCTASENYTVVTTGSLPISISPSYVEIEEGESVQLSATGGENYTWTPSTGLSCTNCPDPIAAPTETTTYYVSATDENGCTGADSSIIVIKLPCGELFVPTIFSPNEVGPTANNKLCVYGTPSCIEELKFEVYDRWGEKVFETDDISKCWDGTYKDKLMNSGIFVYRLYVKLYNDDEPIDISGNTTLVR
jgi:gliding motility-associated-like protein